MTNKPIIRRKVKLTPIDTWSPYQLDTLNYHIFLLLQQSPLISQSQLATSLGKSVTFIRSRLLSLKQQGFLRPDSKILVPYLGQRIQTEVEMVYNPSTLALQRVHVILENIPSIDILKKLEMFIAIHPYTHYHVASFAKNAMMYCQFDIPPKEIKNLEFLLKILKNEGFYSSFTILNQLFQAKSEFDFDRWEFGSNKWQLLKEQKYDITSSVTELDLVWTDFLSDNQHVEPPIIDIDFKFSFDQIDLKLLRELTVNAKVSASVLASYYQISRSRISRRLQRLRKLVAQEKHLFYDQTIFDLSYPQLIVGSFSRDSDLIKNTLWNLVNGSYIPFSTTIAMDDKRFLWFTLAPPSFIPQVSRFLWENAKNLQVLQLDLSTAQNYYFYHGNFASKRQWKGGKKYFIDEPFENFQIVSSN